MKNALFVFMALALAAALPSCSDDQAGSISSRPSSGSGGLDIGTGGARPVRRRKERAAK